MSKHSIRLIVTGLNPDDLVKCSIIANKVRKYTEKYADVHILLIPNTLGFSGIIVEDEGVIYCDDEMESIDRLIEGIAKFISKKKFIEPQIAAGSFK
ncbi:MAG: hypothetical protein N3D82_04130 [Ignisphaera sp.]|nr:hypothetical protein [Ignisphaera sp.]MCX8168196.1 hypothetical protein [Ignisphaera sp.]MDW8084934.1 hypothetical protein [Ignisphaera sp.]